MRRAPALQLHRKRRRLPRRPTAGSAALVLPARRRHWRSTARRNTTPGCGHAAPPRCTAWARRLPASPAPQQPALPWTPAWECTPLALRHRHTRRAAVSLLPRNPRRRHGQPHPRLPSQRLPTAARRQLLCHSTRRGPPPVLCRGAGGGAVRQHQTATAAGAAVVAAWSVSPPWCAARRQRTPPHAYRRRCAAVHRPQARAHRRQGHLQKQPRAPNPGPALLRHPTPTRRRRQPLQRCDAMPQQPLTPPHQPD